MSQTKAKIHCTCNDIVFLYQNANYMTSLLSNLSNFTHIVRACTSKKIQKLIYKNMLQMSEMIIHSTLAYTNWPHEDMAMYIYMYSMNKPPKRGFQTCVSCIQHIHVYAHLHVHVYSSHDLP